VSSQGPPARAASVHSAIAGTFALRILAFHCFQHDNSAAAFEDYRLIAAVQEERLTRIKGSGGTLPWLAIDEVLRIADWRRSDVDAIAVTRGLFPTHYVRYPLFKSLRNTLRSHRGKLLSHYDIFKAGQRAHTTDTLSVFHVDRFLEENAFRPDTRIYFANHHEAHGLAALFFTDWDDALVYTADGVGDNVSYSIRTLDRGRLTCHFGDDRELLHRHHGSNSLASAYGGATIACGFRMHRHEGKLTGLAAYGEPALAPTFARLFPIGDDGLVVKKFKDNEDVINTIIALSRGHPREVIAASIQKVTEDVILASVRHWLTKTNNRRLALAGGLFANVRLNRLLAEQLPVDEVFIFPAMGDEGLPVGAGLCFLRERDGVAAWLAARRRLDTVYLGRNYDREIDDCLGEAAGVLTLPGDPAAVATDLICAGKAGAIYSGRMEYGPRALGARSIVASPADATINERLNKRLERSEFMPFAPYVLEEDAARVFEITDVNRYAAHFMTITCAVRPEWRDRIAAVVHVDGTARPQIVHDEVNPLFAGILRRFRERTGLPVLINTSFNVHEEPIVNRPAECRQALTDGRVDFVVTGKAVYAPAG
jgi:carbamoyltransferase